MATVNTVEQIHTDDARESWRAFNAQQRRAFIEEDLQAGRSVSAMLIAVIGLGALIGALAVLYALQKFFFAPDRSTKKGDWLRMIVR